MKEQLLLLVELQKAELEIGRINIKCRTLPEEISKLDDAFKGFQEELEENRKKFDDLQKNRREKEEKLKKDQDALKRAKNRLSEVKTNKEYNAVLKEIEILDGKDSETEDEIILLLEKVDRLKEDLKTKEKELETYCLSYAGEKEKLERELLSMDMALAVCRKTGDELRKRVADHLLKKYETIKSLNNGLAVTAVWKEICCGCHMKIPAQLYNEVQKFTDLYACPNCSRIIYWYDQEGDKG